MKDNYAGTGLTYAQLNAMDIHQRRAILAETLYILDAREKQLKELVKECKTQLLMDMPTGATVLNTDLYHVSLTWERRYEYTIEGGLDALQNHVSPAEYDATVRPTFSVDRRLLNTFGARGKEVADIITRSTTVKSESAKFEVKPIVTGDAR